MPLTVNKDLTSEVFIQFTTCSSLYNFYFYFFGKVTNLWSNLQ